jgi:hypothetical protein
MYVWTAVCVGGWELWDCWCVFVSVLACWRVRVCVSVRGCVCVASCAHLSSPALDAYSTACDACENVTHEHPYFLLYSVFRCVPVFRGIHSSTSQLDVSAF